MTWNYRVLKTVDDEGRESFEVHEVFYDKQGKPNMCTDEGVSPYGETIEELRQDIERFAAALEKPVLAVKDFVAK